MLFIFGLTPTFDPPVSCKTRHSIAISFIRIDGDDDDVNCSIQFEN